MSWPVSAVEPRTRNGGRLVPNVAAEGKGVHKLTHLDHLQMNCNNSQVNQQLTL